MLLTPSYFLKAVLLPPTSLLWLALIGLSFRRRNFGKILCGLSLAVLILTSLPVVICFWADAWEQYPILQADQIRHFNLQALVVIGGGAILDAAEYQAPMTVNTRTLLRLRYAAKLYRDTGLPSSAAWMNSYLLSYENLALSWYRLWN